MRLPVRLPGGAEQRALVWVSDAAVADGSRWPDQNVVTQALLAAHGSVGRGVEYVRTILHALELWGLRDPLVDSAWGRLAAWQPH